MNKKIKILYLCVLAASTLLMTACARNIEVSEQSNKDVGKNIIEYASQLEIREYEGGYKHIHLADDTDFVLVPEGCEEDNLGIENATLIQAPLSDIYLAATSAMDLFNRLDSLDAIVACSTTADDYAIEEAAGRIRNGQIEYVGKYSAPDYEKLLALNSNMAIESTMINHSPKIKEQLEQLGIPVLIERSSYETSPLGRLEWIKLYGALLGKSDEADRFFDEQVAMIEAIEDEMHKGDAEESGESSREPSVAFFYLSSNGYVNVRKPGDYVTAMIEMAGGKYALDALEVEEENALSTMNVNWESFYTYASTADIIIYNGTIDGGVASLNDLCAKNELFDDFAAVKSGRVYCTNMNMFQCSSEIAGVIVDLYHIIEDDGEPLTFFSCL